MILNVFLLVLLTMPGGLHTGGLAYASASPGAASGMSHDVHSSHTNPDKTTASASHTSNQCLALCQASATVKPTGALPSAEDEDDDDIFDEFVPFKPVTTLCRSSKTYTSHKQRTPKVPLHLQYCVIRQ